MDIVLSQMYGGGPDRVLVPDDERALLQAIHAAAGSLVHPALLQMLSHPGLHTQYKKAITR